MRATTPTHDSMWRLDEVASAGRENLDPDHVSLYDRKEDSGAFAEVDLLVRLGLDNRSTVVDLGAGTGQFTLAAAERCGRVVAVDVSGVMLSRLQEKLAMVALSNVELVAAGFLSYLHQGDPADVVYTRWALHHLPDFWKALALVRMRSFLKPGGILRLSDIVYSFDVHDADDRLEQWCSSLPKLASSEGEWTRADLEEHVRDEHSTFTWLLEPMIERAGFRIEARSLSADQVRADYIARAV